MEMWCDTCKGVVDLTTKTCPNCGGNLRSWLGPRKLWRNPNRETDIFDVLYWVFWGIPISVGFLYMVYKILQSFGIIF